MGVFRFIPTVLLAVLLLAGCASSIKTSDREQYEGPELPRPARILVYDFAASPSDIPAWSDARNAYAQAGASMDANDLDAGRKLGADVAKELAKKINAMGMTAVRAQDQPGPQLNDIAIIGYFSSIHAGSAAERVVIGFGKGAAEVKAHVEGYHMAVQGMQRLGSGTIDSGGAGKSPGLVVPALVTVATHNPIGLVVGGAVKAEGEVSGRSTVEGSAERIADEIAKELKPKFEEQGWL